MPQPTSSTSIISVTRSFSSSSLASDALSVARRRKFDDRAESRTEALLRALNVASPSSHLAELLPDLVTSAPDTLVSWKPVREIMKVLNSPEFIAEAGHPTTVELSPTFIAVGTSQAAVALFDYRQRLWLVLLHKHDLELAPDLALAAAVSSLAISADSSSVAAGLDSGAVVVWDVASALSLLSGGAYRILAPTTFIDPVTMEDRQIHGKEGHLKNARVKSVAFLGSSRTMLLSSDSNGLVAGHHRFHKLMRSYLSTRKLMGQNDETGTEPRNLEFHILDCKQLPQGTSAQITDRLGMVAVLTPGQLVISSVLSLSNPDGFRVKSHFRTLASISALKGVKPETGCLAWYPSVDVDHKPVNAKLAFSWNNVVTLVEIERSHLPRELAKKIADAKDKDKMVGQIPIVKTARWVDNSSERITSLNWLNSEILAATTRDLTSSRLVFLHYHKRRFAEVGRDALDNQKVASMDHHSIVRILRHRLVMLAESHTDCGYTLVTGKPLRWADRLMTRLSKNEHLGALIACYNYYKGKEEGGSAIAGLPHTTQARREMVEPFLLKILAEAVIPVFQVPSRDNLAIFLGILADLMRQAHLKEDTFIILESTMDASGDDLFFPTLETFILSREIVMLPPPVYKRLVQFYAKSLGETLTELICLLSSLQLDVDFTLKVCSQNGLRECSVYVWNALLHDYLTPLIQLAEDVGSDLPTEEKNMVFTYMTYLLSGRQFPSGEYVDEKEEQLARRDVCELLFSPRVVEWPRNSGQMLMPILEESVFPYLAYFLRFNSYETLATIHAFFENPALNDESAKLSRQYIVDAIFDTYEQEDFAGADVVFLAIFIGRNYPKYSQFIRLSESALRKCATTLCDNADPDFKDDAEVALESLLQVYDVFHDLLLLEKIRAAEYSNVLFRLYRGNGNYSKTLEVWLSMQRTEQLRNFGVMAEIMRMAFALQSPNLASQKSLTAFLEQHYDEIVGENVEEMAALVNEVKPEFHGLALNSLLEVAYQYLDYLYRNESEEGEKLGRSTFERLNRLHGDLGSRLAARYIEMVAQFERKDLEDVLENLLDILFANLSVRSLLEQRLRDSESVYALLRMLLQEKKNEEALKTLTDAMENTIAAKQYEKFQDLVSLSRQACVSVEMWELLILRLVGLARAAQGQDADVLNASVHSSFRHMIAEEKEAFNSVFSHILDGATLASVQNVVRDILASYRFDAEVTAIIVDKLNTDVRVYMDRSRQAALEGWWVTKRACTSCGKPMWGDNLEEHEKAWQARSYAAVFGVEFDEKPFSHLKFKVFKCGHGYHSRCLDGLSSTACVICTDDRQQVEDEREKL